MKDFSQRIAPKIAFDMIFVKGGPFRMGSDPEQDPEAYGDEQPAHDVTVPDFFIGKCPVTQAIWQEIMGENPSFFPGDDRPVEMVSWDDIRVGDPENGKRAFLDLLYEKTGRKYRLPTEAEWEYAARGGTQTRHHKYAGSDKLTEVGWFSDNSHDETKPVGLKEPNELDIYDMSGNVWEWCEDDWHDDYKNNPPVDGSAWVDGPERGSFRVFRGGSWLNTARYCRAAYRSTWLPVHRVYDLGFRLVLAPQSVGLPFRAFP